MSTKPYIYIYIYCMFVSFLPSSVWYRQAQRRKWTREGRRTTRRKAERTRDRTEKDHNLILQHVRTDTRTRVARVEKRRYIYAHPYAYAPGNVGPEGNTSKPKDTVDSILPPARKTKRGRLCLCLCVCLCDQLDRLLYIYSFFLLLRIALSFTLSNRRL